MKIYKVYAQCCIAPNPVIEIDEDDARELIVLAIWQRIRNGDLEISGDNDDEINGNIRIVEKRALNYFKKNNFYECGDFAIIRSATYPERGCSYGYSDDFID